MTDVQIKQFRQILFWPLEIENLSARVDQPEAGLRMAEFEAQLTKDGKWNRLDDLLSRTDKSVNAESQYLIYPPLPPESDHEADYGELMYFNPYVRRFLYGSSVSDPTGHVTGKDGKSSLPSFRLYSRQDIKKASVSLMVDSFHCSINLIINRIHFYLFDHGVVLLVVEASVTSPLPLAQVEELLDRFRHIYPPYWETKNREAGHCLQRVRWNNYVNAKGTHFDCTRHFRDFARTHNNPMPFEHWQYLLQPLIPWPDETKPESFIYRLIDGERMSFMAYLAVDDPRLLTRADFVRLCFADGGGKSTQLPYAEDYLKDFENSYCYDRYWDPKMGYADYAFHANPVNNWMTTRILCCGHGFVMVGKDDPNYFTDGKNGALAHFRHHYFQMGLIAHYNKAATMLLADALSEATARLNPENTVDYQSEIKIISQRLLTFCHCNYFTEVSSQDLARELFSLWMRHLDTQTLLDRVKQQAREANEYITQQEQRHQTTTTIRLTVLAAFGLAAGLIGSYLTVDWSRIKGLEANIPAHLEEVPIVGYVVVLVVFGLLFVVAKSAWLAQLLDGLADPRFKSSRWLKQKLWQWFRAIKAKM